MPPSVVPDDEHPSENRGKRGLVLASLVDPMVVRPDATKE